MDKLLCQTIEHELDLLVSILRGNGINSRFDIHLPRVVAGLEDKICIYNIYVDEADLQRAGELLDERGMAIWVRKQDYPEEPSKETMEERIKLYHAGLIESPRGDLKIIDRQMKPEFSLQPPIIERRNKR